MTEIYPLCLPRVIHLRVMQLGGQWTILHKLHLIIKIKQELCFVINQPILG